MIKCIECAWYPWKPGTDISMMPVVRCHPEKPAKKWSAQAANIEHECSLFKAVINNESDTRTENKNEEAPKRSNSSRKK